MFLGLPRKVQTLDVSSDTGGGEVFGRKGVDGCGQSLENDSTPKSCRDETVGLSSSQGPVGKPGPVYREINEERGTLYPCLFLLQ